MANGLTVTDADPRAGRAGRPAARTAEFAPLRVKRVVAETPDAVSLVFDVPPDQLAQFGYQAGQYLTVRVWVGGEEHHRCYSMSSCPAIEQDLQITVKRDGSGVVSNWLNDTVAVGDRIDARPPAGAFVLAGETEPVIAFAGGSGITPVYSLIRTVLATSARSVRLFYANRDRQSVIFDAALQELSERHPDRLVVEHHLDEDRGIVTTDGIRQWLNGSGTGEYYVCGPGPFMDTVAAVLTEQGACSERVHLERFEYDAAAVADAAEATAGTEEVTVELGGKTVAVTYRRGDTLLQAARSAGLRAPSSCEVGSCGTCMARVVDGNVQLLNNEALDDDELSEGWVLTCQSLPTSRSVRVVYE